MKRLTALMALLRCLALLAGCGTAAQPGTKQAETPASTEAPAAEPTPAPTPESTPEPEPDYNGAYDAYLSLLEEERALILDYNWQKGFGYDEDYSRSYYNPDTVNVAFADVWGDAVPELIYLRGYHYQDYPAYTAELRVMGWADGALKELYLGSEYDAQAGGGSVYRVFRIPGERALWIFTEHYSEGTLSSYVQYSDAGDTLTELHKYTRETEYNDVDWSWKTIWTLDGAESTEEAYLEAAPSMALQAAGLLLRNLSYEEYGSNAPSALPRDGAGLTVDQAIAYLRAALGREEKLDVTAFLASVPELYFSSGVGGWSTGLSFDEEGWATLSYHDSEMGDTGVEYPHGTVYVCTCRVFFSDLVKISDYIYRARVSDMDMDGPEVGESWIEDGVRYIFSTPYGLEEAYYVYFYLPGTPTTELPWEFLNWVRMPRAWGTEIPTLLPFWGLYSESDGTGFSGGDA